MKLHRCLYKIGPVEAQRLLKKGTPAKLAHSYLFLSTFSHPAALSVENYMVSGAIVVSCVDGTFRKWMMNTSGLISPEGHLLPLLRAMTVSLVSLIDNLWKYKKYIENLNINDLYIKIVGGQPRLQVLLHENVQTVTDEVKRDKIWENDVLEDCYVIFQKMEEWEPDVWFMLYDATNTK
uniref:Uncharacterized protein n=1 Tax=Leersia perrieri TaxID=77586 RepID=A0A0D9VAL6_9ORYZ